VAKTNSFFNVTAHGTQLPMGLERLTVFSTKLNSSYLPFHDGPNIDPTITTLVALPNYANAKKINSIHVQRNSDDVERHG
jgi:hypothetical protein